ncbi:MAG: LytS/YehU family sensor histidine kinase, partial [Saprospiraceae bacterium]
AQFKEIIPAFCKPWLFRIATLGLIIYLIWYAIGLRIKAIKKAARFRQELAQSEATALKAQMNPHFLFNSLNAIDKYILNNDSAKASDYLSKFSKLIRRILDYSNQSLITLEQEIAIIKLYVKME